MILSCFNWWSTIIFKIDFKIIFQEKGYQNYARLHFLDQYFLFTTIIHQKMTLILDKLWDFKTS